MRNLSFCSYSASLNFRYTWLTAALCRAMIWACAMKDAELIVTWWSYWDAQTTYPEARKTAAAAVACMTAAPIEVHATKHRL